MRREANVEEQVMWSGVESVFSDRKKFEKLFFDDREIWSSFEKFYSKFSRRSSQEEPFRTNPPLEIFLRNFEKYRKILFRDIQNQTFRVQPARQIEIHADKLRCGFQFQYPDTFLLTHFANCLNQSTHNTHSTHLYSYQSGRSNVQALQHLTQYIRTKRQPLFIFKSDVASFGESMDHCEILRLFQGHICDRTCLIDLLHQFCRFPIEGDGRCYNFRGLPTGYFIQLIFENLYLGALDSRIEEMEDVFYIRFGDDLLIASPSRDQVQQGESIIRQAATEKGLVLSPNKSERFVLCGPESITDSGDGSFSALATFRHLGMMVTHDGRLFLPADKMKRIRRVIRKRLSAASKFFSHQPFSVKLSESSHLIAKLIQSRRSRYSPPDFHLLSYVSDEQQLRELDRWIHLSVVSSVSDKGFRKGNFRSVPPRLLRKLGLPSLLHLHRTHEL